MGHLEADADMTGMQFACPHCQTPIAVPSEPVSAAAPPEADTTTSPRAKTKASKRSAVLAPAIAGGIALLIVLAVWLVLKKPPSETEQVMGTKKRDPVEVLYIERLLQTRKSLLGLGESWDAMNSQNRMLDGLESFNGNMRAFNTSLNGLYQAGATFVEARPEFKENNDRLRLPQTLNFTIGNSEVQIALKDLQNAIEHALTVLEVNYPKSS